MLGFITRKEYSTLKNKYLDLQEEMTDKKIVIETLKKENKKLLHRLDENECREQIKEDEILKLNDIVTNLLNQKNELEVKLFALKSPKKRGRKPKTEK